MSIGARTAPRVLSALIAAAVLTTGLPSGAFAQDPSGGATTTPVQSLPSPDPTDGAILLLPDPTNFGGLPTPWDHVTVGPDGRTLMVYFTGGVEGCYGLKGVTTAVVDGVMTISVEMGRRKDAMGKMCIQMTQSYKTPVVLDAPILGGGAGAVGRG